VIDPDATEIGSYLEELPLPHGVVILPWTTWTPSGVGTFDIYVVIDPEVDTGDSKIGSVVESDEGNNEVHTEVSYPNKDLKLPVPYFTQGGTEWCWANALAMVLQYYGKEDHAWDLAESFGKRRTDGVSDWLGNDVANIQQYFEARGLEDLQHLRTPNYENPDGFFDGIRGIVDTYNTPVVISFPLGSGRHFIVVIGYQIIGQRKYLYMHDSKNAVFGSFKQIEHDVFYNTYYSDAVIDCTYLWYVSRSYDPDSPAATMCIVDSNDAGTNYPNPEEMDHVHKVVDPDGVERPESWIILDRGMHYRGNYDLICPGFVHPPVSYDILRYYDTEVDGWKDTKKLILPEIYVSNPNEEDFGGELWIHLLQWDSIIDVYEKDIAIEAWSAECILVNAEMDLQNIREGYGSITLFLVESEGDNNNVVDQIGPISPLVLFPSDGWFAITTICPVDIQVTDPDGLFIDKQSNGILGATYTEADINGDGDPDDQIIIPNRKTGDYQITVIPEPDAEPTDTYTLEVSTEGTTTVLAENVPISEIPEEPYIFESTTRMCGDVNCDGKVTMSDVRKVFNRYLDPSYTLDLPWAADVNCDGKVTMSDVRKVFNRYLNPGYDLNCCCEGGG
jgi:hypothetical protein